MQKERKTLGSLGKITYFCRQIITTMNLKRQTLIVICLLLALATQAQKLTVESMTLAGNDISASQYKRMDRNNEPCGLVKVRLATMGAQFEGNVIPPVE